MFDDFLRVYDIFKSRALKNPLMETLHFFDILYHGEIRKMKISSLGKDEKELDKISEKRKEGIPLEYILGKAPFMGHNFYCTPDTLIPREETELLASMSLKLIQQLQKDKKELTIMDIGTGCGNIAISLALGAKNVTVLASDISDKAVAVAQKNVKEYDLSDRVQLYCGDLFVPFQGMKLEEKVDMVVCNPPYIPTSSLSKLAEEIIDYEPVVALDAGTFGIDIFRRLIADSLNFLTPGGFLIFEIGAGQDKLVTRLFRNKTDYKEINYYKDGEQIRVLCAQKGN